MRPAGAHFFFLFKRLVLIVELIVPRLSSVAPGLFFLFLLCRIACTSSPGPSVVGPDGKPAPF